MWFATIATIFISLHATKYLEIKMENKDIYQSHHRAGAYYEMGITPPGIHVDTITETRPGREPEERPLVMIVDMVRFNEWETNLKQILDIQ